MESTAASTQATPGALPQGAWRVDPSSSSVEFSARGMFGLALVKGRFTDFTGDLQVDDAGSRGELRIGAASLDTRNAMRDRHLRSSDFFDVEQHPTVTFLLHSVQAQTGGGLTFTGALQIGQNSIVVTAPLRVSTPAPDRLELGAKLDVDRAAAGVGWGKLGMIRGDAHLAVQLTLERQSA